jgi:membrane fusion protein, multidrug efflux system
VQAFSLPASMAACRLLASPFGRYPGLLLSGVAALLGPQCFTCGAGPMGAVLVSHKSCLAGLGLSESYSASHSCTVADLLSVTMMAPPINAQTPRQLPRWVSLAIVLVAMLLGLVVLYRTNRYPRTDDAEIFANFIGIAPQVEGPLIHLNVKDNQFVKQGDLLFEIDERPYEYALERALSDQATLEGQIVDEQRRIAALVSAVSVAQANIHSAQAEVANAEQGVNRARAEWSYANDNLHRLEPLLSKQFVTADQVDKARSLEVADAEALRQAESQLQLSQARLKSALAQHEQAQHAVTTLEPLINQRGEKAAAVKDSRYNLNNCRVYAPFDARVTNLIISEGAYAHVGQQMFTLIDARTWWAVGNFREGQIPHIAPGMRADVYVLSRPTMRFPGVVDSVGFGVTPDPDVIGTLQPGLPDVQRTLSWVHLASRFPVRVRVENPPEDLFRVSESAVITIRGN